MAMGRRPEVRTAPVPIIALDLFGLAAQLSISLLRLPFRRPWRGPSTLPRNLVTGLTRQVLRTFIGYTTSLPIDEFRGMELFLDTACQLVFRPIVRRAGVSAEKTTIARIPGVWYRPTTAEPVGTMLYLHGGGFIGTSPAMYAFFTASLAHSTRCNIFVADYRMAPEFPFPAGVEDAMAVVENLLDRRAVTPSTLFVAGDSGGGGLASSLMYALRAKALPRLGGVILLSPEVDLRLALPSITKNAPFDILPWNIPTAAYLHGAEPDAASLSALSQDVKLWPPTFVAFGEKEVFRDSSRRLVEHLRAARIETWAVEAPGMFHAFPILMPWADATHRVFHELSRFMQARLATAHTASPPGERHGQRPGSQHGAHQRGAVAPPPLESGAR